MKPVSLFDLGVYSTEWIKDFWLFRFKWGENPFYHRAHGEHGDFKCFSLWTL